MKKINIFKINCQKIKILKIKHGATYRNTLNAKPSDNFKPKVPTILKQLRQQTIFRYTKA